MPGSGSTPAPAPSAPNDDPWRPPQWSTCSARPSVSSGRAPRFDEFFRRCSCSRPRGLFLTVRPCLGPDDAGEASSAKDWELELIDCRLSGSICTGSTLRARVIAASFDDVTDLERVEESPPALYAAGGNGEKAVPATAAGAAPLDDKGESLFASTPSVSEQRRPAAELIIRRGPKELLGSLTSRNVFLTVTSGSSLPKVPVLPWVMCWASTLRGSGVPDTPSPPDNPATCPLFSAYCGIGSENEACIPLFVAGAPPCRCAAMICRRAASAACACAAWPICRIAACMTAVSRNARFSPLSCMLRLCDDGIETGLGSAFGCGSFFSRVSYPPAASGVKRSSSLQCA
mmetsp:Transcript_75337/g.212968  ORF Transcript_75337/g.212968 Transcript_75337/m.212968 type:complete len:345 (-) Transcript_75337:357-1391(-)